MRTVTAAIAGSGSASEHPQPWVSSGRAVIGRYRLLELIGAGGAGEVYSGHDPQLDRPVAVKRLRADVASSADRVQLADEARINARLEHPNIVRVYDFLTVGNDDYIVSEYIDGSSLDELLDPERVDVEGNLAVALSIIRGLEYAHAAGVVHLDLKTENVLIGRDGVAKIADFGIAQLLDPTKAQTPLGSVIRGTFRSMSPEQTLAAPTDTRSDLFSFGTLLYELFSGVSPFHVRGSAAETIRRIRELQPLPLRELRADVPAALSELVQQLHRKDPADRPRSARDVEVVLRELLERRTRRTSPLGAAEPRVERRLSSVLSIELVVASGSASLEQAESYLRALTRFQKLASLHVERHEAHLASSLGQRVVICLGYPRAHDNNCERAARLFLELRQQVAEELAGRAELRAGLDVGETLLLGGLAAGPSLSAAAALCDAASPGEFLVSSRAQRILRRFFAFEFRGKLARAGCSAAPTAPSLQHHALIDGAVSGSPNSGRHPGGKPPMIGRELELGVLFEAFRASQASGPLAVLLAGSAGVGKSRLLRSFCDRLAEANATVISLHARPDDQYSPFAPFAEFLALTSEEAPRSLVRASEPPPSQPPAPGAEPCTGRDEPAAESFRQRMIETSIARLLASARGQTLVIIVEDVHWLDQSSFELLRVLGAQRTSVPVLIVLSGRPESVPDVTCWLDVQTVTVSRLTPTQALEVVLSLGGRNLSHRVAMQIVETGDGLPLLLEELTLATAEGIDPATDAGALASVPSSLTESLDRRLDLLGVARDTAQLLATLGRETVFAILEKVSELPERELRAQVTRLCAIGLVIEEGEGASRTLSFRHGLLRDAIYERLPSERREQLHRRIAAAAAENFAGWLAERPDLFVVHFARSGQWREAMELAMLAGERSARRSGHYEACVHLQHALELLDKHAPSGEEHDHWELAIRRLLLPSLNASDGWAAETVQGNNARLHELGKARATSQSLAEIWALFAHACLRHDRHGVSEALVRLEEAEATPARDAVLAVARGNVEFYQGEFSRAERSLRFARQKLEDPETRQEVLACGQELLAEGPCYLAWIYAIQGRDGPSSEQRQEMESSPESLIVAQAFGMLFSTALGILRRDHEREAERALQQARAQRLSEIADLLRHPVFRAVADVALGRLRVARGEVEEGLASMRRGFELYEQSGTQLCLAEYAGFVAEAHLELGQVSRARELMARVREPAAHPYCGFYRPESLRIEALVLIAEGRLSEASQVLESARACATAMAIDRHPQLFAARISAAYQRLREASRTDAGPRELNGQLPGPARPRPVG